MILSSNAVLFVQIAAGCVMLVGMLMVASAAFWGLLVIGSSSVPSMHNWEKATCIILICVGAILFFSGLAIIGIINTGRI
jgi:hypothetical protein